MKKLLSIITITGLTAISASAYDFTLDISTNEVVAGNNPPAPMTGSVFIGYFDAGTNFSNPFADLDDFFNPIQEGTVGAGGFQLSLAIPATGTWANNTLEWASQEPSDWDTTFNGQDIIAVFSDLAVQSDGFSGSFSFDGATEYLIVDTGANFQNATTSGLTTTFALLSSTNSVLKASSGPGGSAQIVPEPSAAILLLGGLGLSLLRRRRA